MVREFFIEKYKLRTKVSNPTMEKGTFVTVTGYGEKKFIGTLMNSNDEQLFDYSFDWFNLKFIEQSSANQCVKVLSIEIQNYQKKHIELTNIKNNLLLTNQTDSFEFVDVSAHLEQVNKRIDELTKGLEILKSQI